MLGREIDNSEILCAGQQPRADADPFVVAQAGRADYQKIALENNFAVDGGMRLVQEKKKDKSATDQRHVKAAACETEPGWIEFARDQQINNDRQNKGHSRSGSARRRLPWDLP